MIDTMISNMFLKEARWLKFEVLSVWWNKEEIILEKVEKPIKVQINKNFENLSKATSKMLLTAHKNTEWSFLSFLRHCYWKKALHLPKFWTFRLISGSKRTWIIEVKLKEFIQLDIFSFIFRKIAPALLDIRFITFYPKKYAKTWRILHIQAVLLHGSPKLSNC